MSDEAYDFSSSCRFSQVISLYKTSLLKNTIILEPELIVRYQLIPAKNYNLFSNMSIKPVFKSETLAIYSFSPVAFKRLIYLVFV